MVIFQFKSPEGPGKKKNIYPFVPHETTLFLLVTLW